MGRTVIIIGAGISGLVAANHLTRAGMSVTVLEAAATLGGRMHSLHRHGYILDTGAQSFSTAYTLLPALCAAYGITLSPPCSRAAIVKDGTPRVVDSQCFRTLLRHGLLNPGAYCRSGISAQMALTGHHSLSLHDYGAWQRWDYVEAEHWLRWYAGRQAREYLFEPLLEGFYAQSPEQLSVIMPLMIWSFVERRHQLVFPMQGMNSLVQALAQGLDIRLQTRVLSVEPQQDDVAVHTINDIFHADHVLITTPAPPAKQLYPRANPVEQAVLAMPYSSTIVVNLMLPDGMGPNRLPETIYHVLIPRRERQVIASMTMASRKSTLQPPSGDLLHVMLSSKAGERLLAEDDTVVLDEVLNELGRYIPEIRQRTTFTHITRWPMAMPKPPLGHAHAVAAYHAHDITGRRVWLAGDYLGSPTAEGAAQSGLWAAKQLLAHQPHTGGYHSV